MNRYRETQKKVLEALKHAYEYEDSFYVSLEEMLSKIWDEIAPVVEELLEAIESRKRSGLTPELLVEHLMQDPEVEQAIQEMIWQQHNEVLGYFLYMSGIMDEMFVSTYQQASNDAYTIMDRVPLWRDYTGDYQTHLSARVRITDTNIRQNILPIPWCSDGKTYSTRLYEHVSNFESKLRYVLNEGIVNGRGREWMEWAWRQLTNATAYDTARLIKTETMAFYNIGLRDSYLEMGVEYVEIVGDAECGGICLDYVDGEPIRLEDAEINVELPPYHPNCACSFVSWEETETQENLEEESESQDEE